MQIDPRQMQKLMAQMGIKTKEIDAERVVIERENDKMILHEPTVTQIEGGGQISFQISAKGIETVPRVLQADIDLVMKQTGATMEAAAKALEEAAGDVAQAIMDLKKE